MSIRPLSRRTALRGLGATLALPLLDAMLPASLGRAAGAATAALRKAPLRLGFVFLPNGMSLADFLPTAGAAGLQLPATLAPLKGVVGDVTVLTGLANDPARARGDGAGDHARSAAAFLTGAHPYKTSGADIKLGVSVDQVAAQKIGHLTKLPSLELGLDKGSTAGNCDSGYACAYVSNISWRSESAPMPKEVNPAAVFDRFFGASGGGAPAGGAGDEAKRLKYRRSILDAVAQEAKSLDAQLGAADKHKMDEFSTSIRDVEKRLGSFRPEGETAGAKLGDLTRPDGPPADFEAHVKLMFDLQYLAFRMDLTRVSTLMVGRDGSDRHYRNLGVTEGHHTVSHHGNKPEKLAAIRKIDLFHMQQFAYFLEKLKKTPEGSGTLLDNCLIMLGAGISDGNRHNHDNLPILLAGRAGGALKAGRRIDLPKNTPLCNLYLTMLDGVGLREDRFGDSTGRLTQLA